MSQNNTQIVILAAGDGTRMKSELPKVLHSIKGKTFIDHVVDSAIASGLSEKPLVVVSANHTLIQDALGEKARYAVQHEQLGTGHAVAVAQREISKDTEHVMVIYGDMPFISSESMQKLAQHHIETDAKITLLTAIAPDFLEWRNSFNVFGRVIRDERGQIAKVVEYKDATEEEKNTKEVCTCFFSFDAKWLEENLKKLNTNNAQKEYYLVDLLKIAASEGVKIESIEIPLQEAIGINSKEDLEKIEKSFR